MSISRRLVEWLIAGRGRCDSFDLRMACGRDEVKQGVDAVVPEARVTLDAGLLAEDVVVFALEVAQNFLEAARRNISKEAAGGRSLATHANSLSMLSLKPGVSTMVSAMRTPSSSSSAWGGPLASSARSGFWTHQC